MARQLRIEFPGAVYHVTSRGDRREPIFDDDQDRLALLEVASRAMIRFDARVLAFCLMGNHYHFVVTTAQANLSRVMRQINGVYTQTYNRRHRKAGHLFQGRFKAILVDRDAYLLEVCRYVELNPVRAGLVANPGDWFWSSYRCNAGHQHAPQWMDTAMVHGHLLGSAIETAAQGKRAARAYELLVASAHDNALWGQGLKRQIYLGDDSFVARMQAMAKKDRLKAVDIPKGQRHPTKALGDWLRDATSREEGMFNAFALGGYTMTAIAEAVGLSVSRVSRLIGKVEG